ncbi:hypothetical protein WM2015_2893 [Wenzhouxiangella marina]|uniref:Uncharacterized protein n=1 Tax=Wenzhouxiangella marina TaxID=1579979 RepID=A0A0K0Y008_9GAMM|nr:hypothetical protein WM2015_2893 [Wenzhouxiangella marina]
MLLIGAQLQVNYEYVQAIGVVGGCSGNSDHKQCQHKN